MTAKATPPTEPTIEEKALFYHIVTAHHIATADFHGRATHDWEAIHSALHDLMHSNYRVDERPKSREDVLRIERELVHHVDRELREADLRSLSGIKSKETNEAIQVVVRPF